MNYSFHPEAETEFLQAIEYYEKCESALGYDFALEVYSAVQRVVTQPKTWHLIEDGIRRCLVSRFPFGILYAAGTNEIYIVAVMHLHRNPDYWKHRI